MKVKLTENLNSLWYKFIMCFILHLLPLCLSYVKLYVQVVSFYFLLIP